MDVKEFVNLTLKQISEAVSEFEKENATKGITVSPTTSQGTDPQKWADNNLLYTGKGKNGEAQYASIVNFDIAVTAEETETTGGKVGGEVKVFSFKAGGEVAKDKTGKETAVSRITFKLPLQVKTSETQKIKNFY